LGCAVKVGLCRVAKDVSNGLPTKNLFVPFDWWWSSQCGVATTSRVPFLRRIDALASERVVLIQSANGCEHLSVVTDAGELYTCGRLIHGCVWRGYRRLMD